MGQRTTPSVLLVNPPGDVLLDEHMEPPLGLISIASYVQEKLGIRATVLDLTEYDPQRAEVLLLGLRADIVGFSVYCTKWRIVKRLIDGVRNTFVPRPLIVVGGPNPTAMSHETLEYDPINLVVCGEGEKAFSKIIEDYAANRLDSRISSIVQGERLLEDEFPVLDHSFTSSPDTYRRRCFDQPVVSLEASRGCQNRCIFCNSVVMGGRRKGGVTAKAPAKVIQEITESKQRGYSVFRFNDDSFTDSARGSGLLSQLADLNIRYRIFANAKHLSESMVRMLCASGCFHISVGIESYNPDNLGIIGKNTNQEEIRKGINAAHKAGITVRAYFLVGLPFDDQDTVRTYMRKVAQEVSFDEYTTYPLIPYPGTVLWENPERYGYVILNHNVNDYVQIGRNQRTAFVLRHRNFSESDVASWLAMTNAIFHECGKIQSLHSIVV